MFNRKALGKCQVALQLPSQVARSLPKKSSGCPKGWFAFACRIYECMQGAVGVACIGLQNLQKFAGCPKGWFALACRLRRQLKACVSAQLRVQLQK